MSTNEDLYAILGVSSDASDEDIKKAYRALAKEHHPDKNRGNKEAEEKFKKISAAYDVIGDPEKRKQYDHRRKFGNGQRFYNGGNFDPSSYGFNPFSGFEDMFAKANDKRSFVKNLDISVALDVYAVAKGRKYEMSIPIDECCEECAGKGKAKNSKETECVSCSGTGQLKVIQGNFRLKFTCPDCNGQGKIFERCQKCKGAGVIPKKKKIEVKIPKGIRNGMVYSLRGVGHLNPENGVRGDISFLINIKEHDFFKLSNEDVHVQVPIKFKDFIVGTKVKVPTLYGDAELTIPSGSQNGAVFRLSGKGVPISPDNSRVGDMFVQVIADMPKGFSSIFKEKVKELDDSSSEYEMNKSYSDMLKILEKERERDNESEESEISN